MLVVIAGFCGFGFGVCFMAWVGGLGLVVVLLVWCLQTCCGLVVYLYGLWVVYTGWYWLLWIVTISAWLIVLLLLCLDMCGFGLIVGFSFACDLS